MGTRDRVLGDVHFVRPMERAGDGGGANKDDDAKSQGRSNTEENRPSGKRTGQGANLEVKESLDIVNDALIDINKYRYDDKFVNSANSTCPIVPKFHATFGQPIDRQEISA